MLQLATGCGAAFGHNNIIASTMVTAIGRFVVLCQKQKISGERFKSQRSYPLRLIDALIARSAYYSESFHGVIAR